MGNNVRCLYENNIGNFLITKRESIFGVLCENYHGDAHTTTREWK